MFCTNCGAAITSTQEYCTSCGAALRPVVTPAEESKHNSSPSSELGEKEKGAQRGTRTALLAGVGAIVLLVGVVVGVLVTGAGAASFVIGERYSEGELEVAANAARQSGFENGKKTGYNDGFSDGKSDGYNTGFDAGKAEGYDTGYDAGSTGGYDNGYRTGKADGYEEGQTAGGYSSGYDTGYSSGMRDGCKDVFDRIGIISITYRNISYYKTSFCN